MSTYTEFASIESIDSISEEIIYDASSGQFAIASNETVHKIIRALKDTIVVALVSGFSKTSYLVQDHVKVYQANPDGKFSRIIREVCGQKTLPR
ncbi:unnamed protein product [Rhizophagus irregularis]|nr:unnamed protein product [Rhizophagus irregularis]